ncbi:hypothetical protein ABPG77_011196 [Micractinium sp. CCAP 211/92]
MEASGGEAAVQRLEERLKATHGGVKEQAPFHRPSHIPPGVPKTCYDQVKPSVYLGPRGVHRTLVNRDGLHLQSYFWPAEEAKAMLVFCHGHGSHIMFEILKQTNLGEPMAYEGSWAQLWNQRGISVCGIDLQGCGRSEGKRGLRFYCDQFEDYVEDVLQLARLARSSELEIPGFAPSLPMFVGGISLGGCIAFNSILADREAGSGLFRGAALLAPMLSLEKVSRKGLNPYLRPITALLSKLVPTAAIVATDKNTLYPNIQAQWEADPLACHINTRVRCASEFLRICEQCMGRLEEVDFPFIVLHSENDTMVDVDGSKALYLRAKSEDKTLRLVNHMWHILVREEGNERLNEQIADWILERAAKPAAA